MAWTYDTDFRVATEAVNGGQAVSFAYDADSLLTQAGALALTRDPQTGFLRTTALGSVADSRTYNAFGELASYRAQVGAAALFEVAYVRDALGRLTQQTETVEGITTVRGYGYDLAGRLETVTENGVEVARYTYDANGNRLSATRNGITETAEYDAQDRLVRYGATRYTYTANGELRTKTDAAGTTTYGYDAAGTLLRVDLPGGTVIEYLIDGQNRRIGKKVNGVLVQGFLYRDQLKPVAELDGSGQVVARFVYGSNPLVPDYVLKGGATYRIVTDHLGSPRLVVDTATGIVVQRRRYDEWGNVLEDTNPDFQPFEFAAGLTGRDTGLVRFGARDYEPRAGRWTAKDAIGFKARDPNLYAYVASNPVGAVDPSGLDTVVLLGSPTEGNPFGHTAIAFTGEGVYSFGTGTPLGGSLTDFLAAQATYRDTTALIIPTTSAQEGRMIEHLKRYADTPLPNPLTDRTGAAFDSCAMRTNRALEAGGIRTVLQSPLSPYPYSTALIAGANAKSEIVVRRGKPVPEILSGFNPR